MAVPEGYTLYSWFNQIVGDLNNTNAKLDVYVQDWASLPAGFKTAVKTRVAADIDTAIARLTALKADINSV